MTDESPSNEIRQQLSSLLDGELDAQRARFLLRRLAAESQLRDDWSRWHLARACLRGESAGRLRADFGTAISDALAAEAVPRVAVAGQVLRWVGGFAVAASVAVAALVAVPLLQPVAPAEPMRTSAATAAAPASLIAASSLTERDLRPDLGRVAQAVARPQTDARSHAPALRLDPQLQTYLLRHSALLSGQSSASYLPLVPVVAPVRPWSMVETSASEDAPR